jgi:cytochrome c-type biogenesis protein
MRQRASRYFPRMPLRLLILLLAVATTATACTGTNDTPADSSAIVTGSAKPLKAPAIGAPAPVLELTDLTGAPVSLAALKGSVVVLNVWATWCQPCRIETPELEALHKAYAAQGVRVIGVSIDNAGAGPDVRDFATEFGVTYNLWLDPQKDVQVKFLTVGVPETFVIDRTGIIRARQIGGVQKGDTLVAAAVKRALAS